MEAFFSNISLFFTTWLFITFHKKSSSINRFSVRFAQYVQWSLQIKKKSNLIEKIGILIKRTENLLIELNFLLNLLKSQVVKISTKLLVNYTNLLSLPAVSSRLYNHYKIKILSYISKRKVCWKYKIPTLNIKWNMNYIISAYDYS